MSFRRFDRLDHFFDEVIKWNDYNSYLNETF